MFKIAEINPCHAHRMTVYYDKKARVNPYRVYFEWSEPTDRGLVDHKRQTNRFADLASCAFLMAHYVLKNNEEKREGYDNE